MVEFGAKWNERMRWRHVGNKVRIKKKVIYAAGAAYRKALVSSSPPSSSQPFGSSSLGISQDIWRGFDIFRIYTLFI